MGTTTFPAMNADDAANVQSHEPQQTVNNHVDTSENGIVSRDAESAANLLHTNGGVQMQVQQPSLTAIVVDSNKAKNRSVAIDVVPV